MLAQGTRLGSYEIVAAIGAGGMGEVYRARDARLHRDVVIKVKEAEQGPAAPLNVILTWPALRNPRASTSAN